MREAVPLFAREPHARPGQPAAARPGIEAGTPGTPSWPDAAEAASASAPQPGPRLDLYQDAEQGGQRIAGRLQACALAECGSRLSPDELATALEASTTLPAEVIARLARARGEENVATRAERARAADLDRAAAAASPRQSTDGLTAARRDTLIADTAGAHASADRTAAQLAAESFPCTAANGIRAAVNRRLQQPAPSPARTAAAAERDGDPAAAARWSRLHCELDPLDEAAHTDLVRQLAAAGDRAGALSPGGRPLTGCAESWACGPVRRCARRWPRRAVLAALRCRPARRRRVRCMGGPRSCAR